MISLLIRETYLGGPAQAHVSAFANNLVAKDPTGATGAADFQIEAVAINGHSSQPSPDDFLHVFCRQ